ncbi:hypothetical protein VIBNISFn118_430024 [Vibrio nigripulchritudo SFn118]|nr:hypothetical protein VIBNISFn118_430024 [Vibrio nigripulchritudo SFn118]
MPGFVTQKTITLFAAQWITNLTLNNKGDLCDSYKSLFFRITL